MWGKSIVLWTTLLVYGCYALNKYQPADVENNEFAEFEEFDDDIQDTETSQQMDGSFKDSLEEEDGFYDFDENSHTTKNSDRSSHDDEAIVEEETDEFDDDMFTSEEDDIFEGAAPTAGGGGTPNNKQRKGPELKIADVPHHLRTHWDSYYIEMLMVAGLLVYATNFLAGRSKNSQLAHAWFNGHRALLKAHFSSVGDDGAGTDLAEDVVMKESEHLYSVWCSGRVCCEGMLVTLRLLKRQCLISTIQRVMRPELDQIRIKVQLGPEDMDTFVLAVAQKKTVSKIAKELQDLNTFCGEKKQGEKYGLPSCFSLLSEIGDAANAILDSRVVQALNKYQDYVNYIHISDQYSGSKLQEDAQPSTLPTTERVLIFNFNVAGKSTNPSDVMEDMVPMLQLVLYIMDKVRRVRLSREGRIKAERNRQRVEESFLKQTHAQRQEAAQLRREERRRAEKERIMNEEDPEKQRRLEEREHKRELKKRNPLKVKQLKVRAM